MHSQDLDVVTITGRALAILRDAVWSQHRMGGVWSLPNYLNPHHSWMTESRRSELLQWLIARENRS